MRVIKGSHAVPLIHRTGDDAANMLPFREEVEPAVDERKAVDLVLKPGEFSLHHPMAVHGSAPNVSQARRVGLAVRYISASVRQRGGERGSAVLVRGRDHGHFDLEKRPSGQFAPADRARHAELFRRWMKIVTP
jgi:ectoine hydroxylase-related dioxygenase (phytanoyl-CoA dioxygenase family)